MADSSSEDLAPMQPDLCLKKLLEIKPLKHTAGAKRVFNVDQLKQTALNEFIDKTTNEFDIVTLIPFLVGAVQHLAERVETLESQIASL